MSCLRIGTCSWKYDSWKGIVYPEKSEFNFLEEYSKKFNTVEIDQWFWSLFENKPILLPKPIDVRTYFESVPDDFKFTIKVPNSLSLTHFYNRDKSQALKPNSDFLSPKLFEHFIKVLQPLEKKIGVLMFQFEYLNKSKISGLNEFIERFEIFLSKVDRKFQLGIEIRNPNFLSQSFFEFLSKNGLTMVFLQGYYMPPIWDVFKKAESNLISPVILRLHGADRSGIEERTCSIWNKIVEPKDDEIEKVSKIIFQLLGMKIDLFINVNNHYEGSAPLTIEKILKKLKSDSN